jgi:hypothetical protein
VREPLTVKTQTFKTAIEAGEMKRYIQVCERLWHKEKKPGRARNPSTVNVMSVMLARPGAHETMA